MASVGVLRPRVFLERLFIKAATSFCEVWLASGSQITAGENNGRRVFAMEISPAYVNVAVESGHAATDKDAILDGEG